MLHRSNIVLGLILLIQVVLLAASVLITSSNESRTVEPILRDLESADIDSIVIADDVDAEVNLARSAAGWVLPAADDFPADNVKIEELLQKLTGLTTNRLVAANPANFARLEVAEDDFRRQLSIVADDETHVLYLGGSAGVDTVYARRHGENRTYLGSGLSAWEASTLPSGWIDTSYLSVSQADVLQLSFSNANGSFKFLREGEIWIYQGLSEDETFDESKMSSLLRNATSIQMQAPLGLTPLEEFGVDDPAVTVEVTYHQMVEPETGDDSEDEAEDNSDTGIEIEYVEHSYELTLGAVQDDGNVVLKSSAEDYFVAVRESVLQAFSEISHDDLIVADEASLGDAGENAES